MNPEVSSKPLILLVDDTAELGVFVQLLGKRQGQEVVVCPDALAGWTFLQRRRPTLVLLDHNLPGLSGVDLGRMIRATPALATLPLALLGHWHQPQDILAGLETGIDFVVSKDLLSEPERWQTRLGEILRWLDGRPTARLVSWLQQASLPELPATWCHSLNGALRHGSLRRLRPEILRLLLLRSLRRVVSSSTTAAELEQWVAPEEASLLPSRLPPFLGDAEPRAAAHVIVLVVSLAEQTWCLLGTEATAAFRTTLAGVIPGLEELLTF